MKKSTRALVSTLTVAGFLAACQSQAPVPAEQQQPADQQSPADEHSQHKHEGDCGEGTCA
jgi:uncharacterized low-complexity protein